MGLDPAPWLIAAVALDAFAAVARIAEQAAVDPDADPGADGAILTQREPGS